MEKGDTHHRCSDHLERSAPICYLDHSGGWQEAVIAYAQKYAGKTKQYYHRYIKDFKAGKYGLN